MMWLNKTLKAISYLFVRVMSTLSLAFLALLVTSPVYCLAVCIADMIKMPSFAEGRLLYGWLLLSVPFFIGFFIHTEIKLARSRKQLKKQEQ